MTWTMQASSYRPGTRGIERWNKPLIDATESHRSDRYESILFSISQFCKTYEHSDMFLICSVEEEQK
jgi:hypothetical protein